MELNLKLNDRVCFDILNGRVKSDIFLDKPDIKKAIEFLESQVSVLKIYHDGISMGMKKMHSDIDSSGIYKHYKTGFGPEHADIP